MSKYGNILYGVTTYGEQPKVTFSVEPMSTQVVKFSQVNVFFQPPSGGFTRFRIVRNQYGFPETSQDGVIVYEQESNDGSIIDGAINLPITENGMEFVDGVDNPDSPGLVQGRNVYYRCFLYTTENYWILAGSVRDVIPADTGVTDKLINTLPRVYTSTELSPLGTVDSSSALYQFLDGFSFTYEQMLTQLSLLRPSASAEKSNYTTIPGEFFNLGLNPEPTVSTVNQRRLIREAIYLYSQKGTKAGIENYTESLTGYIPTVTVSPNLLLTPQDSTFYNSIGNWVATNATISASTDIVPNTTITNAIDSSYTCKIVATGAGSMVLGASSPITLGIPVSPEVQYTYSFQVKSPSSAGTVTPSIIFYDKDDGDSYTATGTAVSANNTWKSVTQTVTVTADEDDPGLASYAVLKLAWSAAGTYYVDMVCLQQGGTVAYDEARATTVLLNPVLINYIENPSFEVDSTGWSMTNLSFTSDSSNVPTAGYPSTHSGKFVAGSGSWSLSNTSAIPVDPGTYFNVSMFSYSEDITSMNMYIDVYDSSDTLLTSFHKTHNMGATWVRDYLTGLIDVNSAADHAHIRFTGSGAGTFYLDMVQAQDTYAPTDYFDGSMPETEGVVWQGTANDSISLCYPAKLTKFPRLAHTLNDWVPMNAWWRVTTPAGLEYTNLTV